MTDGRTYADANPVQKVLRRFAASGPGSWLFARVLHHIDRPAAADRGRHIRQPGLGPRRRDADDERRAQRLRGGTVRSSACRPPTASR